MDRDIEWGQDSYTQAEFVAEYKLPSLVRIVSENDKKDGALDSCLGTLVDTKRDFLVYSQRRRTKAYAKHLVWDPDSNSYLPDDIVIEIPKDYPGFFEIIPEDPRRTVTHLSSISDVVAARCTRFLVKTMTGGFRTEESSDHKLQISSKHMVYPGEVLTVVKTVTKRWKLMVDGKKSAESRYLQCVDSADQEVCIPLVHPGIFCALYDDDVDCSNFVWSMDDLLTKFDFPLTVRLSFGWPPQLPRGHHFSGVLKLFEKRRPDTLVLYNMQKDANVVVELPFDMKVRLQPATNQEELSQDDGYLAALEASQSAVYFYVICMKALHINYKGYFRQETRIDTISRAGAQLTKGLLANAQDMKTFDRVDFYPPIRDRAKDAAWNISFTDTSVETNESDIYFENDKPDSGKEKPATSTNLKTDLTRTKSLAGHSKAAALGKVSNDFRPSSPANSRRSRIFEIDRREANC